VPTIAKQLLSKKAYLRDLFRAGHDPRDRVADITRTMPRFAKEYLRGFADGLMQERRVQK